MLGLDCEGISNAILSTIDGVASAMQGEICPNFILSGGTLMFPGIEERIADDLHIQQPLFSWKAKRAERYSAWIGGSTLSSVPAF
jgi:actin-related protein